MKNENVKGKRGSGDFWINFLLVAGVTIAAPRLAGAFGQLIGVDVINEWRWFATMEVFTGFALAILEGLALAHISNRWKRFGVRSPYWWILAFIQAVLLLALPFVSTVYLVAAQYGVMANEVLTWRHIFVNHLVWLWSYSGAAISTIIVMAIGIVQNIDNVEEREKGESITIRRGRAERISVADRLELVARCYHEATPPELQDIFEDEYGYAITLAEAEAALLAARAKRPAGKGKRPVPVTSNGHKPS